MEKEGVEAGERNTGTGMWLEVEHAAQGAATTSCYGSLRCSPRSEATETRSVTCVNHFAERLTPFYHF